MHCDTLGIARILKKLRKIGQKLRSLSWTKDNADRQTDRQTYIHSSDCILFNVMHWIGLKLFLMGHISIVIACISAIAYDPIFYYSLFRVNFFIF